MSQPISVSVQMDAASFHDFAAFDLLRHRKAWHRPLMFTAILLVSAGFCLSQVGQKDGAALLTVLLAVVALLVLAGGGAFAYVKFIKPNRSGVKVSADPDEYDFPDEEYVNEDEPAEAETEAEHE